MKAYGVAECNSDGVPVKWYRYAGFTDKSKCIWFALSKKEATDEMKWRHGCDNKRYKVLPIDIPEADEIEL